MNLGLSPNLMHFAYLVAAVLFIIGIKQLSSPKNARMGNMVAAVGMAIALVMTLLVVPASSYAWILGGIAGNERQHQAVRR